MTLRHYAIRRLVQLVPVVLVMLTLNFVISRAAPGDPAVALAGENATPAQLEFIRQKWGLDQPLLTQFGLYFGQLLRGDLGFSYAYGDPVLAVLASKVGPSLLLLVTAMIVSIGAGLVIGVYTATHIGSRRERLISALALVSYSTPVFWLGLLLILIFSVQLRWLPTSGMYDVARPGRGLGHVLDVAGHLVLPVLTLSLYFTPVFARLVRASLLDVLREDFIRTARAVGLSHRRVLYKHALRNALQPVVSFAGLWFSVGFTGSVLAEIVFGWPGMGRVLLQSIFFRDYPMLMGVFLFVGVLVVVTSLIADLINAVVDPRVVYT